MIARYDDNIVIPAYTVQDIALHPAYEKYILNTTKEDAERMRKIVSLHEYWRRITKLVTGSELSVRVPSSTIGGFDHYKECEWSDPDCRAGPDTCVCSAVSSECYDIIRLLNRLRLEDEGENEGSNTTGTKTENKKYELFGRLHKWWWW